MNKYFISANWKMNGSKEFTRTFFAAMNEDIDEEVKIIICPADCYLNEVDTMAPNNVIRGAQNISFNSDGAYTGEVSSSMLKDLNVEYVIIGHSERREYHAETNEIIRKKFNSAVSNNLKPILCVGESLDQRQKEETFNHLESQIVSVINKEVLSNHPFIIAYEPIWAIGTGETATPEIANEVHIFIQETLDKIDSIQSKKIAIIYGGSVNSNNAYDLFKMSHINGALIGGSSLDANEFNKIYNIAKEINNE
jgi:triosephosphate isomerase|tara:strand:+ start:389 stop:1144 length:756 start_codon:yes stop_codon:yes gene_type:complete